MGRTLDEDAVLKEIGRWIGYLDEDMIERIKIGIKKLPEAQQWIPCSERLPVEGESVFLCDRDGNMTFGQLIWTDTGYKWESYAWWYNIDDWNAWKPLPEPWKGEEPCA